MQAPRTPLETWLHLQKPSGSFHVSLRECTPARIMMKRLPTVWTALPPSVRSELKLKVLEDTKQSFAAAMWELRSNISSLLGFGFGFWFIFIYFSPPPTHLGQDSLGGLCEGRITAVDEAAPRPVRQGACLLACLPACLLRPGISKARAYVCPKHVSSRDMVFCLLLATRKYLNSPGLVSHTQNPSVPFLMVWQGQTLNLRVRAQAPRVNTSVVQWLPFPFFFLWLPH